MWFFEEKGQSSWWALSAIVGVLCRVGYVQGREGTNNQHMGKLIYRSLQRN